MKKIFISAVFISAAVCFARDIDVEKHVRTYWKSYQGKKFIIGNGDKRWPVTPELKAERIRHFAAVLQRFAPHHVEEAYKIDRIFNWKPGTYLGMLRYGGKAEENTPKPSHECTSWVSMENMTGGRQIIMHKNRDSSRKALTLLRRAMPGKHAWIGSGSQNSFYPAQGINDRGVVVLMNSGDPHPEAENSQYGMSTPVICRILLEESGTADEAVALLKKIICGNAYNHVECGSVWFIGDSRKVYIIENNARNIEVKQLKSGFVARANAFHYPEMQIYSTLLPRQLDRNFNREFAVRDFMIEQIWRKNGIITPLDNASASRIDKAGIYQPCYPPCGRNTISSTTFVIDKEYPEYLSSVYLTLSWPRSSCFLPVPMTVRNIPAEILDGSYSSRSFALQDKKQVLLPADKLAALEKRLYDRQAAAIEKARILLRTSKKESVQRDVAKILNDTFAENIRDIRETTKK